MFGLDDYTLRTVALGAASLGGLSGALGSFAVLRKQSLLSDTISHAALPGIVVAFMLTHSKVPLVIAVGAAFSGWLATRAIRAVMHWARLDYDTVLAGVLAVFFGLGSVLLTRLQKQADASQAGLDKFLFGQAATLLASDVRSLWVLGGIALAVLLLFWKEFKLLSFDPDYAASLGYSTRLLDELLTGLLILATVLGLQCVGVVLMSALVIAPAVAARQWTRQLGPMVLLATAFGAFAGLVGTLIADAGSIPGKTLPTGPAIALVATAVVLVSLAVTASWQWLARRGSGVMLSAQWEVLALATVVAVACALPGTFLVLRKQAMLSDAISHVILLGIVLGYLIVGNLDSPWLFAGAALSGVAAVLLIESLQRTKRLKEDAAIGLVFPAFVALGILLASRYTSNVHLDVDAVLLGELAYAPFTRYTWFGFDLGPRSLVIMTGILTVNALALGLNYKQLKLATFDPTQAALLGLMPGLLHYGLMLSVSVTTVAAFDAVGPILVVAFMVVPAATARLLTHSLARMLALACLFGASAAVLGYFAADYLDSNIAGMIATVLGAQFAFVLFVAPETGIIAQVLQRRREVVYLG